MGYKTTRKADADIIDIYVYGAQNFGTAQAERYHTGLINAFERLALDPYLMRERREIQPPIRLFGYESHLIAYLIDENRNVLIARVLHGRQDWMRHLEGPNSDR
jgi:toxin ParE1/3/4